jgi:hypothetical protein
MMLPDYEALYAPYAASADLATTMNWFKKQAASLGVSDEIRELAIAETFLEMSRGKVFPTDFCDCGCGVKVPWSCMAMNHYVMKKMLKLRDELGALVAKQLNDKARAMILLHMEDDNKKFTQEQLGVDNATSVPKKSRLLDFSNSEVVRGAKWIGSLFHQ